MAEVTPTFVQGVNKYWFRLNSTMSFTSAAMELVRESRFFLGTTTALNDSALFGSP